MLTLPESDEPLRLFAIDPGSDTLGIALLELDLVTLELTVVWVQTFTASTVTRRAGEAENAYFARLRRVRHHYTNFYKLLTQFQPHLVTAEAPYLGRFATAFEALVEVRGALQNALHDYNPDLILTLVDPPSAKKAVGAIVKKGSKENVAQSVLACSKLKWGDDVEIGTIDEHGFDAIAVGVWRAQQYSGVSYV
jgi:Holliday junction resolvasome RuvABC endonuclease subunit